MTVANTLHVWLDNAMGLSWDGSLGPSTFASNFNTTWLHSLGGSAFEKMWLNQQVSASSDLASATRHLSTSLDTPSGPTALLGLHASTALTISSPAMGVGLVKSSSLMIWRRLSSTSPSSGGARKMFWKWSCIHCAGSAALFSPKEVPFPRFHRSGHMSVLRPIRCCLFQPPCFPCFSFLSDRPEVSFPVLRCFASFGGCAEHIAGAAGYEFVAPWLRLAILVAQLLGLGFRVQGYRTLFQLPGLGFRI